MRQLYPGEVEPSPEEVGAFVGTRTPITRTRIPLRKIGGNPGWWDDLKAQLKKVPTPIYIVGGFGLIMALVLAKGQKGTWLKKV